MLLAQLSIENLDLILKVRRLRWYGHVERSNGAVKSAYDILVDRKRGTWRPKADRVGSQRVEALGYCPHEKTHLEILCAMRAVSQLPER